MNEAKLRADLERGTRAERILTDPLVVEAFKLCEEHFIAKFKDAPLRDTEGIVKVKQLMHTQQLFRHVFEQALRDGKIAANALDPVKRGAPFLGDIWQKVRSRS